MKNLSICLFLVLASSCAGTRSSGSHMTSHAESIIIIGMPLIGNDYDAAWSEVPEGATVHSVTTSAKDWTSLFGIMNNIFGFSSTQISWSN
jgi:hypothetical protein